MGTDVYGAGFYASQRRASKRSAAVLVPLLMALVEPASVVDVGCGVGAWLQRFAEEGVSEILGLDGPWVDRGLLEVPAECFVAMDLSRPDGLPHRFDLATCLEVAEHIPRAAAPGLVALLCQAAPAVCFGAAIPGQGGAEHLNEQWPGYWSDLFSDQGYRMLDVIRPRVWEDSGIEPWSAQNTFLYVAEERLTDGRLLRSALRLANETRMPLRVVHPELFRRFVSLEYVSSGRMLRELIRRAGLRLVGKRRTRPSPDHAG